MHVVEHVAASLLKDFHVFPHVLPDLVGSGKGKNVLGIYTASPKRYLASEHIFELFRFHIYQADLDGIENIDTIVDKLISSGMYSKQAPHV